MSMNRHSSNSNVDGRLLQAVVEQMKLPLIQMARQAELGRLNGSLLSSLDNIELAADSALRLLDSYLLSARLAEQSHVIELEPVSVSAVLNDIAHQLARIAKEEQCELQLHLSGRYEPVVAHRAALEAALISLGYSMIEARAAQPESDSKRIIKLAAHRGKSGIVAGIYTDTETLSGEVFRRGQQLYGNSRQSLPEFIAGSGAGVFVANALFESMSAKLRVAHHQSFSGLAATLLSSQQLSLI